MKPRAAPAPSVVREPKLPEPRKPADRASQIRTAWILASVAAVFFAGVIVAQAMGEASTAFDILGLLVVGYLVFVIARVLRSGR